MPGGPAGSLARPAKCRIVPIAALMGPHTMLFLKTLLRTHGDMRDIDPQGLLLPGRTQHAARNVRRAAREPWTAG